MFKLNIKQFLTREPTKYDIQGMVSDQERLDILKKATTVNPKLLPKGGTSLTNPYKASYDVIITENREQLEIYKKSVLWSPQYTPRKFKYTFLYPAIGVLFGLWYIRYIQWPSQMMKYKKKGYVFTDLEGKGWIDDWEEEEDQEMQDMTITEMQIMSESGSQEYRKKMKEKEKYQMKYLDENRKQSDQFQKMQKQFQTSYDQSTKSK